VAWVPPSQTATWQAQPWWWLFDTYLTPTAAGAAQVATQTGLRVHSPSARRPLGEALGPQVQLRVRIHAEDTAPDGPHSRQAQARMAAAHALNLQLKAAGLACWICHHPPQKADPDDELLLDGRDESVDQTNRGRMVDVCVFLAPTGQQVDAASSKPNPATLNIWWHWKPTSRPGKPPKAQPEGFDLVVNNMPSAATLMDAVEKRIGHTFYSP